MEITEETMEKNDCELYKKIVKEFMIRQETSGEQNRKEKHSEL